MEVLVLQTDIRWLDVPYNLDEAGRLIDEACGNGPSRPDLVVLPEMFATGFCMEPEKCAPAADGVLAWMKGTAARLDAAVAATVAVMVDDSCRNRFYFVRPDGMVTHYDKRHLFTFCGEDKAYESGNKRIVVRWRGFDILLQTCYDIRFPVFSRNTDDYHLALYCASWVDARINVWDTLLRARAIENAAYVIGSNRVGEDPEGRYPGHSVVVGFKGNLIAGATNDRPSYIKCTLSLEELHGFREKFPVLADADEFVLACSD